MHVKHTALPVYMAAIRDFWLQNGMGALPKHHLFKSVTSGIKHIFGLFESKQPKLPITPEHLLAIKHVLRNTAEHRKFWAMCVLAFFGFLRMSELLCLRRNHIKLHTWGLTVTIPYSKTNLRPVTVVISKRKDDICPLAGVISYLLGSQFKASSQPLFPVNNNGSKFTPRDSFIRTLKAALYNSCNIDAHAYSGHSFRRGGASFMARCGLSDHWIMTHGRWKSDCYRRYIDLGVMHRLLATAALNKFHFSHNES